MGTSYSGPANAVAIGSPAVSVTGTPSAGQVPVATDTTDATWQTPASATVSSVFGRTGAVTAASGDYTASQVTGAVSSVTAADASVTVGGTATAPTLATGRFDQIATLHPAVANVNLNSHKVTSLANGTAASDAAAFGQIPVPANGYGIVGNTGLTPTPAVALTSLKSFITATVSLPQNTPENLTSLTLAAGVWVLFGVALINDGNATPTSLDLWIGTSSASTAGALGAASGSLAIAAGSVDEITLNTPPIIVSPVASTTYYLNAECNGATAATVEHVSQLNSIANVTGLVAIRLA